MRLNVTTKTSRLCTRPLMTMWLNMDVSLTVLFFNCWPWDTWELDYLTQTSLTRTTLIEVQRVSHVCSGTWEIGNDQDLQRTHFLNIWRSAEDTLTLTLITSWLETNLSTTISLSMWWRSSLDFWTPGKDWRRWLHCVLQWLSGFDGSCKGWKKWFSSTNCWIQNRSKWYTTSVCFMMFHGQSSKSCGAQLSADTLVKRRPSQEEGCPCIEFVSIMLDKTIFLDLRHSVERSLRPCVGSASTIKLMWWQVMAIRQHTWALRRTQVVILLRLASFSSGSTECSTLLLSQG